MSTKSRTAVKGHARQWWHFAYTCVLEKDIRRLKREWSWSNMRQHRVTCRRYAVAYATKLTVPKPTKELLDLCAELEDHLDLFNLRLIRQRAELLISSDIEVGTEVTADTDGGGTSATVSTDGWYDWMTSWWWGSDSAVIATAARGEMVDISE